MLDIGNSVKKKTGAPAAADAICVHNVVVAARTRPGLLEKRMLAAGKTTVFGDCYNW